MRPTYDDLLKIIDEQHKTIARLEKRVAELEERLNLNSSNSSKPPSSDQKKNKQAPKGGAKKGHAGHFRKLFPEEQISKKVLSPLDACEYCGSTNLKHKSPHIFQQVDIPEVKPFVTQIERQKAQCLCCQKQLTAPFPKEYDHSSFGPRLISFIGAGSSVYRMSKRTIQTLLKTLFGIEISLGSIPAMERKLSKGLQLSYEALADRINESKVAYVDETSFRQSAKTHYVWTATTKHEALIRILPTRGLDSLSKIRPRSHSGITVTDRYPVYSYERHQYCLAHINRDFKRFAQRDGPDGELGRRALFELRGIFMSCRLSLETMRQHVHYRKKRLKEILYDVLANCSEKFSGLANRLLDHFHRLFLFTRYSELDCTNNAAERTLRHIVIWRKTSYGTQSDEGSRFLERAVSIWMTLKKQDRQVLPYFEQAYRSTFQPGTEAPAICPH